MALITVVGSINMDVVMQVRRIPEPGETVLAEHHYTNPGGKGANQAVAAARLDNTVSMVGAVGDDSHGRRLTGALMEEGVDIEHLLTLEDQPSGMAVITVDRAGENSIVVSAGANGALDAPAVSSAADAIESAEYVLAQLEIPLSAVSAAAKLAQGTFMLNPAPARRLPSELMESVDVLIPNEAELAVLAGRRGPVRELAGSIDGPSEVVVTLGSAGAYVRSQDRVVPAHDVDVVDTTAAGDSFCGALADALGWGKSMLAAVEWAVAASAFTVTRSGAQQSLPTTSDVHHQLQGQSA